MSTELPFTPRETEGVILLSQGLTTREIDHRLEIKTSARLLSDAKHKAGVTTQRALVYVSLARQWIPRPPVREAPAQLSELEELLWAGLRIDVPDARLPGTLSQLARTPKGLVSSILENLKERHQLNYCGLITRAFSTGLLSGREGTHLPQQAGSATSPASTAAATPRPQTGLSRSGRWDLTGRQQSVLALLPTSRSIEEAAGQLGIRPETFRRHLQAIFRAAGVTSLRALTHRALADGLLDPPEPRPGPGLTAEVAAVWRGVVLDVPDAELPAEIAAVSGLPGEKVRMVLQQMRAGGDADWQLVVRGWERGVITAQDAITRPGRRSGRRPSSMRPTSPSVPRPGTLRGDRLLLLAETDSTFTPRAAGRVRVPTGQAVVTGRDVDLVRVDLGSCRQLLAGARAASWGPVIGDVEGNIALLVTRPGVLPARWRARYGRLWRRDAVVYLPPEYGPSPSGAYWAVSCRAPLWPGGFLQQTLNTLPTGAARPETSGGGR
ncbi:hypothetical protein [Streptomyces anulatus]|uniref:hypothetical protein n=1 Tax=Streptomyces anulatus TaxID=1892 RepID=UPI001C2586BD|nr:hypothetical protein [Streptomyces anulatus]